MARRKNITDKQLKEAVKNNTSISGILLELGYKHCGGSFATVKQRIKVLQIDTSHMTGKGWCIP